MKALWLNSSDPRTKNNLHYVVKKGLESVGYSVTMLNPNLMQYWEMKGYDLVVSNGLRKNRIQYAEMMKEEGRPFLVYDLGHMNRGYNLEKDYYQIGYHGLGWKPDFNCNHDRLKDLGIEVLPSKPSKNKRVLVCGQKFNDAQHQMNQSQVKNWCKNAINGIEARFKGEIVFRPHPKSKFTLPGVATDTYESIEESIQNSSIVVTYNSTVGVEAIRQGIPLFCSEKAHYSSLGNTEGYDCLLRPFVGTLEQRTQYLANLAYSQWNCKEILKGKPFIFLKDFWEGNTDKYKLSEVDKEKPVTKAPEKPLGEGRYPLPYLEGKRWYEARKIVHELTGTMPKNKAQAIELLCQIQQA